MANANIIGLPAQAATWAVAESASLHRESGTILVDLDGTLTDPAHRVHHLDLSPPDWVAFSLAADKDPPNRTLISRLRTHHADSLIVIVSGRPSYAMQLTKSWLTEHDVRWEIIALRPGGDAVSGVTHKLRVLTALRTLDLTPVLAIDDSTPARLAFAAEGIPCQLPIKPSQRSST